MLLQSRPKQQKQEVCSMSTLQEKQLQFNPHLVMSNDGGQLSNDSGLLLLFEFFHKIKFKELVNELLHIDDSRNYCTHDYIDLLCRFLCS